MSDLHSYQQPHYDMLMLDPYRAWVTLPVGWGRGYIAAKAIKGLTDTKAIRNVLYVAPTCMQMAARHELENAGVCAGTMRRAGQKPTQSTSATVCTERMWTQGHDTWVKYGGYDLVVLDLCRNPNLERRTELAALQTTLGMGCRVWILGGQQ